MEKFAKYLIEDTATIKDALVALNKLSIDPLTLFVVNNNKVMTGTLTLTRSEERRVGKV